MKTTKPHNRNLPKIGRLYACLFALMLFAQPLCSQINQRALFKDPAKTEKNPAKTEKETEKETETSDQETDTDSSEQETVITDKDTATDSKPQRKPYEYRPVQPKQTGAQAVQTALRSDEPPSREEPDDEPPQTAVQTAPPAQPVQAPVRVQRQIATPSQPQPQPQRRETTPYDDRETMQLVEKALQDLSGMLLLAEEELPPADMPDSVYIRRLAAISGEISMAYNSSVRKYIIYYMQKYPTRAETLLGLCNYYFPIFEEILDAYNIPLEMRVLPVIESAMNPVAVSRQGATGMWQFMLGTARRYGLTVSTYVDERRDFIAATHAAAKYMNMLYSMFNDWTLALAAYNCGEGNVKKAIVRAGGANDYWAIHPYLPNETRNYVPLFIAASYMVKYYKEHRLVPKEAYFPETIDTFMVNSKLHFKHISETANIPLSLLRDLNPQYKRDIVPGNESVCELRIPAQYTAVFIEKEKEIYGQGNKYFATNIVVNPAPAAKNEKHKDKDKEKEKPETASTPSNKAVAEDLIHEVAQGETLGTIASKYGIKLTDLYAWNNLTQNSTIYPGQKIAVREVKNNADADAAADTAEKYHTVQSGDSFWSISQKYDIEIENLLKANGMKKNSNLKPGRKIIIPNN